MDIDEVQQVVMVWWLMMWFASDEGEQKIPTQQEWLSCELAAALHEAATGEKFLFSWRHDEQGREHCWRECEWTHRLNHAMETCGTLHTIVGLLKTFIRYESQLDHDESWHTSLLKDMYEGSAIYSATTSTFVPSRRMYEDARRHLECHAINGISHENLLRLCALYGQRMRPYVMRDLAYIKQHYFW